MPDDTQPHTQATCRACGALVDRDRAVWGHTYWHGIAAPFCTAAERDATLAAEAIECQTIDGDCNDCKHFRRGKMLAKGVASACEGHCAKLDKPTIAYPKFASSHPCFEHRKTHA